jgi:hypothetical protein
MLGILNLQPALAAAEEARGNFTLTREVHWQKQIFPAGEYAFSVQSMGPNNLLIVRGLSGSHVSAMMVLNDVEWPKPNDSNQLVLVSENGQSFVSALDLPEFDMVLHFKVPSDSEGQRLTAKSAAEVSSAR